MLTPQHLNDVLAGKKLALARPNRERSEGLRPGDIPSSVKQEGEALFQVLVRPSEAQHSSSSSGGGNLTVSGSTVLNILSSCCDINSVRIMTNSALPDGPFDFVVKTPTKQYDTAKNWLRQAVETTFGLTTRRETREMDVFILTAGNSAAERLTPTVSTRGSNYSDGPGRMEGMNMTIASLAWNLERMLKKPVVDETRLTNRYDVELKWEAKDPEHPDSDTIAGAVREQLGLELTPAKRPVEVLVVDQAK